MTRAIRRVVFLLLLLNAYLPSAIGRVGGEMHMEDISLGVITNNDLIPNPANTYDQTNGIKTWSTSGDTDDRPTEEVGMQIKPLGGQLPMLTPGGNWTIDSFFDITYRIDLRRGTDPFVEHIGVGTAHIVGAAPGGVEPRVFDTEMLELNISGDFNPASHFLIRESPTLASTGKTTVEALPGGQFRIDSFFDIFTEMSVDGGQTWAEAIPEPSTALLLVLGACGLVGARRRWR
jgi:hypothetical protein